MKIHLTPWYIVSWNELGELTSLYDKEAKREVLEAGTVGNEIVVYEDIPKDYDAWNVESYYSRKHWKMSVKKPCTMTEAGEICAVLHTELSYESSVIEQDIVFFAHTRRIDFKTKIDWKEEQQLVKAEFHLDVMTRTAACEIPYGVMERPTHRNTSWQRAQFEMCAHRFVDLSEPGFGVALLNVQNNYGILEGTVNGFATAVGFTISIVLMAGLREKIEYNDIPKPFRGMPIVLLTAGLMSIAFFGFSGMI